MKAWPESTYDFLFPVMQDTRNCHSFLKKYFSSIRLEAKMQPEDANPSYVCRSPYQASVLPHSPARYQEV